MRQFFTEGVHPSVAILFVATLVALTVLIWRFRLLLVLKWWFESGADVDEVAQLIEAHEKHAFGKSPHASHNSMVAKGKQATGQAIQAVGLRLPLMSAALLLILAIALGVVLGLSLAGTRQGRLSPASGSAAQSVSENTIEAMKPVLVEDFSLSTDPEIPEPGRPYTIKIEIDLSPTISSYPISDLSGTITGSDGYQQAIPNRWTRGPIRVDNGRATVDALMLMVGRVVDDTVTVRSASLGEERTLHVKSPAGTDVSFWGISEQGKRILYLIDASSSMNGKPIQAAIKNLSESIEQLTGVHQIQVHFFYSKYRSRSRPESRQFRVIEYKDFGYAFGKGGENVITRAKEFVSSSEAFSGGSDFLTAVKAALKSKPDVIFLVTAHANAPQHLPHGHDHDLKEIQRLNIEGGKIHCVQIQLPRRLAYTHPQPVSSLLSQLASDNGGKAIAVEIRDTR